MSELLEKLEQLQESEPKFVESLQLGANTPIPLEEALAGPSPEASPSRLLWKNWKIGRRPWIGASLLLTVATAVALYRTYWTRTHQHSTAQQATVMMDPFKNKYASALNALKSASTVPAALKGFEELSKLAPENARVWVNLSMAYKKSGDLKNAKATLLKALDIDNQDPLAHNNLAMIELDEGFGRSALKHLATAASLDPQSIEVRINLARAHEKIADFSAAISDYTKLLEMPVARVALSREILSERIRRLKSRALMQDEPQVPSTPMRAPASESMHQNDEDSGGDQ